MAQNQRIAQARPKHGPFTGQTIFGDSFARVRAANLGVAVVRDLVKAIVTGTVAPGDILPPEGTLSQQFAVSRTVIRESMKRVEEKGLVTVSQGRGTVVNQSSKWNVLDPDGPFGSCRPRRDPRGAR
jgi:DNA-binding FadR family transcriptional regulator